MILWLILIVVQNSSLSVTIPDGYRDVSKEFDKGEARTKDAIVLLKGTLGAADAATINFGRGEHHPADKLHDAKQCAAFAEEMRKRQHADGETSSIVEGPTGKTCQIALRYEREKASVVSTILRGMKDTW